MDHHIHDYIYRIRDHLYLIITVLFAPLYSSSSTIKRSPKMTSIPHVLQMVQQYRYHLNQTNLQTL